MPLDPALLAVLACPIDKGPLVYVETESVLYNPRLRRLYRIENELPILLPDHSVPVGEADHARLLRGGRSG